MSLRRLTSLALISSLMGLNALNAEPTKQWKQGDPSADEQFALEVINRVRIAPEAAFNFYAAQAPNKPNIASVIPALYYFDDKPYNGAEAVPVIARTLSNDWLANKNNVNLAKETSASRSPYVFYPLFTEQAKSLGTAFVSGQSVYGQTINSGTFYTPANAFLGSSSGIQIPAPGFQKLFAPFGQEPGLSGSNATGGTATVKAGSLGSSTSYYRQQLSVVLSMPAGMTMREGFFARTTDMGVFLTDKFTSNAVSGGSSVVTTYPGKARMIGIYVDAERTSAPGAGYKALTMFSTDNEAFSASDLPFGAGTVFITGVVYTDLDHDGAYSPGEGIGGVTVMPSSGDWYAVTTSSGGWSIPVQPNTGAISVTLSGNGVSSFNTVTVGGDSVKVDFAVNTSVKPSQVLVPESDGTTQITNLSTRGVAEPGANALVGGFVISGTGTKKVLIRGVAKSLLQFGINVVLTKPLLTLYDSNRNVITAAKTQDTYVGVRLIGGPDGRALSPTSVMPDIIAANQQAGAFAFVPADDGWGGGYGSLPAGDTAIIAELKPGAYTVTIIPDLDTGAKPYGSIGVDDLVNHTNAFSGMVLLELYDMSQSSGSRFINISSRGKIESGIRQMVVGFTIGGSGRRQILARGIGPGLNVFGVPGTIYDSAMDLNIAGVGAPLASNDDWGVASWTDQSATVMSAVGAFALSPTSGDSVVLARLSPGGYSIAVRPTNNVAGVGLAEVYEH